MASDLQILVSIASRAEARGLTRDMIESHSDTCISLV
jgi:hypothetical protein